MPRREWVREFQLAIWNHGFEPYLYEAHDIGYVTAPDVNATLVRIILDATFTMNIDSTVGGGPIVDWWNYLNPVVAVGRDQSPGSGPLSITGFGDERVMGTAGLALAWAGPGVGEFATSTATWHLTQTLDVHGMRKALPGAPLTVAPMTVQVYPLGDVTGPGKNWLSTWWGYMRTLWEIP
jgi:hypothetical protein